MTRRTPLLTSLALGTVALSALSVGAVTAATAGGRTGLSASPPKASAPRAGAVAGSGYKHLIVIPEENHSYAEIVGSPAAPYFSSLASSYGLATNYTAGVPTADYSLASYLLMTEGTAGTNANGSDCAPTECPQPGDNIFHQASVAGIGWHGYAESMPTNCDRSGSAGLYAARHLPAPYFTDLTDCPTNDTGLDPLPADLTNGLPAAYNMVTPNLDNDMHDGSVQRGDAWLKAWVPRMMAGKDYRAGDLAIIITWDEGSAASNQVATVVISPTSMHIRDATAYTHASLLRTAEDLLGLPPLGAAATATSMAAGFRLGSSGTPAVPVSVFAVAGTTHALYARRSDGSAYTNLGGYLLDPPAVARTADGTNYYIGVGTGSRLFVRTDRIGWRELVPGRLTCRSPGAAAAGQRLFVGCRGSDNHLRSTVVDVSGGNLPSSAATVYDLGGVISSGPGVAADAGSGTYYVTATRPDRAGNNLWRWSAGSWSRSPRACRSQPAVSRGWFACRGSRGTLRFWRDGDVRLFDAGGVIVGTPAVAAAASGGGATVYVEGTNGCVYAANLGLTAAGPWRCLGGQALGGVAAAVVTG